MLQHWTSHESYQNTLRLKLIMHLVTQKNRVSILDKSISKLYLLNLDNLHAVIKPLYTDFGQSVKISKELLDPLY